jgi:hypothetical protein
MACEEPVNDAVESAGDEGRDNERKSSEGADATRFDAHPRVDGVLVRIKRGGHLGDRHFEAHEYSKRNDDDTSGADEDAVNDEADETASRHGGGCRVGGTCTQQLA